MKLTSRLCPEMHNAPAGSAGRCAFDAHVGRNSGRAARRPSR
ncbi:hypothetical protein BURCENBC7_AP2161 [Burkholderia cenocepacia BC7]|nr:hypothetical protein BURCENBC7_AP2161 [Burkholderia cenocepacia BC7]